MINDHADDEPSGRLCGHHVSGDRGAHLVDDINYLFDNDITDDDEDGDDDSYQVVFADTMSVVIGEHTLATDGNFLSDNDDNDSKRLMLFSFIDLPFGEGGCYCIKSRNPLVNF